MLSPQKLISVIFKFKKKTKQNETKTLIFPFFDFDIARYQWTSWSRPSQCSTTCGQGIITRIRECKPVNENDRVEGVNDCRGPATLEEVCFKRPCRDGSGKFFKLF